MYHQLVEIHTIATAQVAEYTHWRRLNPTSSPVWAGTDQWRLVVEPDGTTFTN
jgi:hypothetical protein